MKKIAIIYNTSYYLYLFRKGLVRHLLERGFNIHCIALKDEYTQPLIDMGCLFTEIAVISSSQNPIQDIKYCKNLHGELKKIKPDLVLNYTAKPLIYGTIAAKFLKIPIINNIGGLGIGFTEKNLVTRILVILYKYSQRKANAVFFQNTDDMNLFIENKMVKSKHAFLLPGSGVDLNTFECKPLLKKDRILFVLIARMLYSKGVLILLEAAEYLKNKGYTNFDIKFIGEFGVKNRDCVPESVRVEWQKHNYIQFIDRVDNVKPFLEDCDCMVLPSYYREGTPRSVLEAMSTGRPVITTNMPGCRDTVVDGYNGYICEPKDVKSLAVAMEKILNLGFEKLQEMGRNSRKLAEEKYDEDIIFSAYDKQINLLLS